MADERVLGHTDESAERIGSRTGCKGLFSLLVDDCDCVILG